MDKHDYIEFLDHIEPIHDFVSDPDYEPEYEETKNIKHIGNDIHGVPLTGYVINNVNIDDLIEIHVQLTKELAELEKLYNNTIKKQNIKQ